MDVGGVKGQLDLPDVCHCKVSSGTANMTKGPAMTKEEAAKAIQVGFSQAQAVIDRGSESYCHRGIWVLAILPPQQCNFSRFQRYAGGQSNWAGEQVLMMRDFKRRS